MKKSLANKLTREILEKFYVNEHKPVEHICEELEIKAPTLYKYLKKYNIHRTTVAHTQEHKKHISNALKGRKITWGNKISKALKGKKKSEQHRRRIAEGHRGMLPWNKAKKLPHLTEEHKAKISEALKGRKLPDEARNKISKAHKGKHLSPASEFQKGHIVPEEWRKNWSKKLSKCPLTNEELQSLYWGKELSCSQIAKLFNVSSATTRNWMKRFSIPFRSKSEATKLCWKKPQYQERVFNGIKRRPSKGEQTLIRLMEENKLPFEYCGDGRTFIGGRCPDFIIYDRKKIIEFFGDYWHDSEEEKERKEFFAKYGFETLVIWEHELNDEDGVLQKIKTFIQ
jgi:very-short-patch-repair endonuclease